MPDIHALKSGVQVAERGYDKRSDGGQGDENYFWDVGCAVSPFNDTFNDESRGGRNKSGKGRIDNPGLLKKGRNSVVEMGRPDRKILRYGDSIGRQRIQTG